MARVRLRRAWFTHTARETSVLSSLLRLGCRRFFVYHCLNSLQRLSKLPLVDPKMLFRRAVSFVVSCPRQGRLFTARVRLIRALFSHNAREASVLSSLLWRGRLPEWLMYQFLNCLQRSISSLVDCWRHRSLLEGFGRWVFGRWAAMMLLRCAVSAAVSILPLGVSA